MSLNVRIPNQFVRPGTWFNSGSDRRGSCLVCRILRPMTIPATHDNSGDLAFLLCKTKKNEEGQEEVSRRSLEKLQRSKEELERLKEG